MGVQLNINYEGTELSAKVEGVPSVENWDKTAVNVIDCIISDTGEEYPVNPNVIEAFRQEYIKEVLEGKEVPKEPPEGNED